jgi:hypothetical protein
MSFPPESEVRVKSWRRATGNCFASLNTPLLRRNRGSAAAILHLAGPGHPVCGWRNTGDRPTRMA